MLALTLEKLSKLSPPLVVMKQSLRQPTCGAQPMPLTEECLHALPVFDLEKSFGGEE